MVSIDQPSGIELHGVVQTCGHMRQLTSLIAPMCISIYVALHFSMLVMQEVEDINISRVVLGPAQYQSHVANHTILVGQAVLVETAFINELHLKSH